MKSILLPLFLITLVTNYFAVPILAAFNNVTSLSGTWSSGSGAVLTGSGFADPTKSTFTYPAIAGWSFSFTDDGHFEQAQFTWNSNASDPHCIEAVVIWQHGTYVLEPNGSIKTTPFVGDGKIQVQNACAAITSVISYYNQPGLYQSWTISIWKQKYMLQLQAFDGALMPRMYLVNPNPKSYMLQQIPFTNSSNSLNG